jgi:hypothetical protein
MIRIRLLLVLALLAPAPLHAAEGPAEALARLLASDFDGDSGPRHGNVVHSGGPEPAGCGCREQRENFNAESGPLVIASGWQVVASRLESRGKARVTVRFRTMAVAEGRYDERRIDTHAPRDEEVSYRLWRRQGRWLWVDPPKVPHVGPEAALRALSAWMDEQEGRKAVYGDDWPAVAARYQAQRTALEALLPAGR